MTTETATTAPFNKNGIKISWSLLWQALVWLVPILALGAMLYLRSEFATHQQVNDAVAPMKTIPARVERLEEFKAEQKKSLGDTAAAVNIVQQDMAGMKAEIRALKDESTRNTDRILQRLDRLRVKE